MATLIKEKWRQGRHLFLPGQKILFGDPDADSFLVSVGVGETIPDGEAEVELSQDECVFDPATVFLSGEAVLSAPVKKALPSDLPPTADGVITPVDGTLSTEA